MREDFYYPSADGKTTIHADIWMTEQEPKAIVQIVHGMTEFAGRYDRFASFLTRHGFIVVGNDHLGHGESVLDETCHGYFAEKAGNACLLKDIHFLRTTMEKKYPKLPYFFLGHSMGSFLTRQYICRWGKGLTGAIIMGTGTIPEPTLVFGWTVCQILAAFKGQKYVSRLVFRLTSASNNKRISHPETPSDWLSKDADLVRQFRENPLCQFQFTVNAYANMFHSINSCQKPTHMAKIPKSLPLYLVSGEEDPVGDYGEGVRKAFEAYRNAGLENVEWKLYPGDRHEILNETDREQVYCDLLEWLETTGEQDLFEEE